MFTEDLELCVTHGGAGLTCGSPGDAGGLHGVHHTAARGLSDDHGGRAAAHAATVVQETQVLPCVCRGRREWDQVH